ncbi:MAG TPA: RHS repeat-associated core domain-containing protein [Bryobacteraceae bacterium]|nr:RHS repeat-associated core domain-containing protein [Bryobacteraceae bacterium]
MAFSESQTGFHRCENWPRLLRRQVLQSRLGRFIGRDPLADAGGMNLYGFCGNDPIDRFDVNGNSWLSKLWDRTILSLGRKIAINWDHQGRGIVSGLFGGPLAHALEGYSGRDIIGTSLFGRLNMADPALYNRYGGMVLGAVAGIVVGIVTENPALGAMVGGFVSGSVTTYMQGGNLGQALEAGAIGAGVSLATYGVLQGVESVGSSIFSSASSGAGSAAGSAGGAAASIGADGSGATAGAAGGSTTLAPAAGDIAPLNPGNVDVVMQQLVVHGDRVMASIWGPNIFAAQVGHVILTVAGTDTVISSYFPEKKHVYGSTYAAVMIAR